MYIARGIFFFFAESCDKIEEIHLKKAKKERSEPGTRTRKSNREDEKSSGDMPWPQELTAGGRYRCLSSEKERFHQQVGCIGRQKNVI